MKTVSVTDQNSLAATSQVDNFEAAHDDHHQISKTDILRIGFVGLVVIAYWLHLIQAIPYSNLIGLGAAFIGGFPIFEEAWEAVRERRMTMELSMTIALVAALAISETFTALVIVFFVLIAEELEKLTVARGRSAIKSLLSFLPQVAFVRNNGNINEVSIESLKVGDTVVVKPGQSLAVDGVVIAGNSFIDESTITGESKPAEKSPSSTVYAGTINQTGSLDIRTDKVGEDTAFGKIINAVEHARESQAPVQQLADQLAGYLVYFALTCAVITFLVTHNVKDTISVLIVAGACGIAAGTPLAILGGIGQAARLGSIVKGGLYLELLGKITTVIFDKTGTLTFGKPEVVGVCTAKGIGENELIAMAGVSECKSEHPLANPIMEYAKEKGLHIDEPQMFTYVPGKGIICELDGQEIISGSRAFMLEKGIDTSGIAAYKDHVSEVLVAKSGKILGAIYLADKERIESKSALKDLHKMGIRSILLTGDTKAVAEMIGKSLGMDEILAEMLPEDKQQVVKRLVASGNCVAMVGDGINDAPALVEATVGVAIGSGTDVARECADVVLIGSDLNKFVDLLKVSRRCRRIIMTNFAGTLIVDTIGVGLAAFGFLNPLLAALIHVISELVFILNSARLIPASAIKFKRRLR